MNHDFGLFGRWALVTGSGQGLGLAIARGLAAAGASVLINDVDPVRASAAASLLRQAGYRAQELVFDVTDQESVRAAVQEFAAEHGGVDILVNNAGIHRYGALEAMPLADWQRVLDVNLTGAFITAQAAVQAMIPRGRGKVINICSLMSEAGRPTTGN